MRVASQLLNGPATDLQLRVSSKRTSTFFQFQIPRENRISFIDTCMCVCIKCMFELSVDFERPLMGALKVVYEVMNALIFMYWSTAPGPNQVNVLRPNFNCQSAASCHYGTPRRAFSWNE
jgi:hypothetical protein